MIAKGFKKRYFSLAAIAATVSMVSLNAKAATIATVEKVLVSASKTLQEESDISDDVTVITSEEIKEKGYRTLKDALGEVSGVAFASNGGFGQTTGVYLRGLDPKRTVVLIDGVRFNDPSNLNGAAFELINLNNVERIEIIKGPQSGIWGADAIAGVINIITKQATKEQKAVFNMKVEGGSFDTKIFSIFFAKKSGNFDISLGFDRFDTKGFSAAEPGQDSILYGQRGDELDWEDDGYQNSTLNIKLGYDITQNDRVEASFTSIEANVHYDTGAGIDGNDIETTPWGTTAYNYNDIRDKLYNIKYLKNLQKHQIEANFKYSKFKRSQYGGYSGSVKEYEIKDRFDYNKNSFLQAGVGYQRFYQGLSAGVDLNEDYHNRYVYATNYNKFLGGKTIFSQTLRSDNYDSFDDKITYKLGVKQYIFKDYYLSANYGSGYQVPSIFQLNYNATQNLNPEKSVGYDISLGNDILKITYFKTKVKDLIQWIDPDNNWLTPNDYYYNMSGEAIFKGVEAKVSKDILEDFFANMSYSRFITKDTNGKSIANRPNWKLGYGVLWYPSDVHSVGVDGYYVGERYDFNGYQTGKYNVTNITLRHNFAPHFTGVVKIVNVFDRFYQEINGYGTPGRSFYIGIEGSF